MGSLAASPGWTKLSNGLILQWGYYATYSAGFSSWTGPINFATTFPNACFGITFGHNSSNSTGGVSTATTSGIAIQTSTLTTSHFYFECGGANADGFYWFAYGY
jgi:hypothetical protein